MKPFLVILWVGIWTSLYAQSNKVIKSDAEWKKLLTAEQYYVMRQKGTEPAFTGKYWNHHGTGIYRCAGCRTPLFDSRHKFDSGSGWPSFYQPYRKEFIAEEMDYSYG
ncbi:MAG: peptide-methionine (R)-S-oxide reductase, partial [Flammeovirgaceae bacterium]|nr:peptide-methionine (R)-S-oxide reductase [Flammeovirgaceae bacterium]MDW8286638.1 peptide-methionine (R)-S-oxide reductase [Flammeovirgaceae bacterium]